MRRNYSTNEYIDAAGKVRDSMLQSLDNEPVAEHQFSNELDLMIHQSGQQKKYLHLKAAGRVVASFFLVFLVGFGIILGANSEARAAVCDWVKEVYENYILYHFRGTDESVPGYSLGWVPDGMELRRVDRRTDFILYVYSDDASEIVFSSYNLDGEMYQEFLKHSNCIIDNCPADYTEKETENNLVWVDESISKVFELTGKYDFNDLEKIAKSLIK